MTKSATPSPTRAAMPQQIPLAPAGLRLLGGEKIEATFDASGIVSRKRRRAVSPLLALAKLTDGFTRPSIAAAVTKENENVPALTLYDAFFPRDAHISAYFLRDSHPKLTEITVLESLRHTGVKQHLRSRTTYDEQEFGKVPHEIRDPLYDPIAQKLTKEKGWGWPYYGAVDTTGKNILAITHLALQPGGLAFLKSTYTGLDGVSRTVADGLSTHINWIRSRMDLNPEGLLEMLWLNPRHHANQTWTDSPDAFHHADGSWPAHYPGRALGVASLELQAETYDALVSTAEVYKLLQKRARGQRRAQLQSEIDDLLGRAARLRTVVLSTFWVPSRRYFGGYFARGTDRTPTGQLRPLAVRSSDMGHLLNSRLLDGIKPDITAKREAVIRNLFSPEMLCLNGIRTLSSDAVRYHKDKYHNGTAWPWATYYIALGLRRHGYHGLAHELERRILSLHAETKLLPEYGSGSNDPKDRLVTSTVTIRDRTAPEIRYTIIQPAQEVQAWTAAAVYAIQTRKKAAKQPPTPPQAVDEQKRHFEENILRSLAARTT